MMEIKRKYYDFAISDFDGTIFNSNQEVSKKTVETINNFTNNGGVFAVCTGRMTGSIVPMLKKFGITKGFVISYNGAEISKIETGEKIYKQHIDTNSSVKLLKFAEKNSIDLLVYPNDVITVNKGNEYTLGYMKLNGTEGKELGYNVSDYFKMNDLTTGKALFLTRGNEDIANKIMRELPLLVEDKLSFVRSNKYHIDVMKRDISKGETVKVFSKIVGKSLDRLICFGDEMNDESMIKVASVGAVPSNGAQALKKIADIIIDSCDNDGVRKAMEEFCI